MTDLGRLIEGRFPAFKANKRQEIVRLVFEIAKKESCSPESVVLGMPVGYKAYPAVKGFLINRRFPEASLRGEKISEAFSALEIDPLCVMPLERTEKVPVPKQVFIERSVEQSDLAKRIKQRLRSSEIQIISSYRDYCHKNAFDVPAYNRRTEQLFIVREESDYYRACPCSPGVLPCGYHNVNLGFGCPFECSYCFLQNYTNAPGIMIPANLDDFFNAFKYYKMDVRVGSGETTDSLVYDDLTGFAPRLVEFFREYPQSTFEFKTKSDNVEGLLGCKAASNVVVGWSLNPQPMIDTQEYFTAPLSQRLDAASRCAAHGYRLAFHFDPVFYFPGWEVLYEDVVEKLFQSVPACSIAWISIGTLRMTREQKKIIENRFPQNTILDAELFTAKDGKLRYADQVRLDIYSKMVNWIDAKSDKSTFVYLCMEMGSIWKIIQGQRRKKELLIQKSI